MYNIYFNNNSGLGPDKVARNLLKGFDLLGIKYTCNDGFNKIICLQNCNILKFANSNMIVGPNICVLPPDNQYIIEQKYKYCIVPSQWVYDKYKKWLDEKKLKIWASGIDTDYWKPEDKTKKYDCLIYYKRRSKKDLDTIINLLSIKKLNYFILTYGSYKEDFFKNLINESKFGIIIDGTESQGIAIMEMMSSGLPLFIWDVEKWEDRKGFCFSATSAPYFDLMNCGFKLITRINDQLDYFISILDKFNPRKYIVDNFNLKKQAQELISLL